MTAATHVRLACLFAAAACLDALLTANVVFAQTDAPRLASGQLDPDSDSRTLAESHSMSIVLECNGRASGASATAMWTEEAS